MKSHVKNKHELQPRKRILNATNEIESSQQVDDKKARLDTVSIEAGFDAEFDFGDIASSTKTEDTISEFNTTALNICDAYLQNKNVLC